MKCLLALVLLAVCAAAQQQSTVPCPGTQPNDGKVCGSKNQAQLKSTPVVSWEQPPQAIDYQTQIQLRNQSRFTLAPAVTRSEAAGSNYIPPPALTPLHQTSDDFASTAGFPLGSAMTHEIREHRAKVFVKKFCRSYGSGAAWWYEFENGKRIEGVCQ